MIKKLLYNLNLIKKEHYITFFIYVTKYNKPTKEVTDKIRWFPEHIINCKKKELNKCIDDLIEKTYPKYKDYIYVY